MRKRSDKVDILITFIIVIGTFAFGSKISKIKKENKL